MVFSIGKFHLLSRDLEGLTKVYYEKLLEKIFYKEKLN